MTNRLKAPRISFEERVEIERLRNLGYSCSEIARKMGRSKNGIVFEVRRGGGTSYTAKGAQEIVCDIKEKRYDALRIKNKNTDNTINWKKRLENLEMQIEILYDCLKEVNSR